MNRFALRQAFWRFLLVTAHVFFLIESVASSQELISSSVPTRTRVKMLLENDLKARSKADRPAFFYHIPNNPAKASSINLNEIELYAGRGSGHSGVVQLVSIKRRDGQMAALRFRISQYAEFKDSGLMKHCDALTARAEPFPECDFSTTLEAFSVDEKSLGEMTALITTLRDVKIYPPSDQVLFQPFCAPTQQSCATEGNGSAAGSSASYMTSLNIKLSSAYGFSQYFAGYPDQRDILRVPANLMIDVVNSALNSSKPILISPPNSYHRKIFRDHFLILSRHFNDPGSWFVKEAMIKMMGHFGAKEDIPTLTTFLKLHKKNDSSAGRLRYHSVNALASITGTDLRYDGRGKPKPIDDVSKQYLDLLSKTAN